MLNYQRVMYVYIHIYMYIYTWKSALLTGHGRKGHSRRKNPVMGGLSENRMYSTSIGVTSPTIVINYHM